MKKKNEPDSLGALIKQYIFKVYGLRYFYIGSFIFFISIAFLINKCSQKVYQINATVGPVQESRSAVLASNQMFNGLGSNNSGKNIEDAINSLNSFSLSLATIKDMNMEIGYFSERRGPFKRPTDLYLSSPFQVNIDKSHIQAIDTKFYVTFLNDSTFRLVAENKKAFLFNYIDNIITNRDVVLNIDTIAHFNKTISGKDFKFSISNNNKLSPEDINSKYAYFFRLFHPEELAKVYLGRLKIEPVSILASIINLQITGANLDKSISFLNSYINTFLEDNLNKKNMIAKSTVSFIDSQISEASDSLVKSESRLRNYRSTNQVMDLSFQGKAIYEQMAQIETDRNNLEIQIRYYNYVIKLFATNQDISGVVPPNSANITDPIMNKLITDLIALNAERASIISKNKNEKNLFLAQIDNKIKAQKQVITENVTNNLNTLNLSLNELNYRADKLSKQISNLPKTELNMVGIQRKYNLNDAIYTFLLQKKSEAAIALASNYPDYELLEPAREITSKIIKPKVITNYLLFLFLGVLIPSAYLIIKDLLNNKISSIFDIEHLLDRTVFGIIYRNNKNEEAVVVESPKSAISESFRVVRSSIFLKLKSDKSKVILVTSSQPGDGKSFISFNLAASIASVGYKTIIVDLDLRRPILHLKFNNDNSAGVSNIMNKKEKKKEDYNKIVMETTSIDSLSFLPAGPVLPNPSELIDLGVLDDLFLFLESKYDYIIIDTSPIGIVSDSIQLMKYATLVLVVSRVNSTEKDILSSALSSLESNKIDNYEVILNDLDIEKSPYSGYKNYYLKE